jgi:diacylglycerol kinase (ATP)
MKPLIILNPSSQSGKTGEQADELERVIRRYVGDVERAHTEAPRHAVEIAEQAARDGRSAVIAVGGDGTIHEITNGLMRARADGVLLPKLGIVGQGTGGDFRKTLGLEHRLDKYCQAIAVGTTRKIDVGAFRYRNRGGEDENAYFINILSMGLGGLVDEFVAESRGQLGGTLAYFSASFRALLQSEVGILDCVVHNGDEQHEVELVTRQLAVCNGRYFGSGMEVAPMAKPDDGLFDVISLGAAPKLKFALGSLAVYGGSHVDSPDVEVFSCDRIDIELRNDSIREQFPLDVDGEPLGTLPLSIEVVPQAIEIFAPLA